MQLAKTRVHAGPKTDWPAAAIEILYDRECAARIFNSWELFTKSRIKDRIAPESSVLQRKYRNFRTLLATCGFTKRQEMINQFKSYLILLVIAAILPGCTAIKAMKLVNSGEAVPGDYTESAVPYTMAGHPILIKARLNNSEKEHSFIFDTGALTMISQEVAEELDLSKGMDIEAKDIGGKSKN